MSLLTVIIYFYILFLKNSILFYFNFTEVTNHVTFTFYQFFALFFIFLLHFFNGCLFLYFLKIYFGLKANVAFYWKLWLFSLLLYRLIILHYWDKKTISICWPPILEVCISYPLKLWNFCLNFFFFSKQWYQLSTT